MLAVRIAPLSLFDNGCGATALRVWAGKFTDTAITLNFINMLLHRKA